MKSFRNHFSLIIALFSILFSIQVFMIVDRSISAYKQNLAKNYTVIVVSQKKLSKQKFLGINKLISKVDELSADSVIKRLSSGMNNKNIKLLKLSLPKFYKISLFYYPSSKELKSLRKDLLRNKYITKIEDFSFNHDTTYKLLLLFKGVVSVFAIVVLIVTTLLIFKELKIWQYKHNERMSIMGLFGAATWLRSAVLFRLAIVDALISTLLALVTFIYISVSPWILKQFEYIGIKVIIFNNVSDFLILLATATFISMFLVLLIVLGHKEEV
ncbi:MAG: cell division protein FtsX [Sulfurimonas sp.]|nr:MAG: cell division protein FtsX [Sulfurimonas sp.]